MCCWFYSFSLFLVFSSLSLFVNGLKCAWVQKEPYRLCCFCLCDCNDDRFDCFLSVLHCRYESVPAYRFFFVHFATVRDCRCCPTVSLLARAFATFLYESYITLNRWVDFNRIGRADYFSATFLCTSFFYCYCVFTIITV